MSDIPKSLFEEGGHPTNSKKTVEDTSAFHNNLSGKLVQTVSSEYHPPPFEQGPDGRPAKVPRIEPRDVNKGLPLLSVYRLPSSSNDSCLDPLVARDTKVENRDANVEGREYNTEARIDPQCINNEKSVRLECREGDNSIKGTKQDRSSHMVSKGDIKMENDSLTAGSSCLNWKDSKEQYRGKVYTGTSEVLDQWHLSRQNSHVPREIGKSTTQGHDHLEAHETVGEKKVELKGDDQIKEKDKNRKDENHMGLGDRGKCINDRRNILQIGNNSSERRESAKEEQEPVGERDRNDLKKDKEQQKEKENDHIKREILKGIDKEGLHNEREYVEGSVRMTEHENLALEDRGHREIDGWKAVYRDIEDRKRESDVNVEGNRREKHSRCYEKESDDGCMEGDVGAKREREIFGYGVQQRKRMLRPRGSPQAANRVPHFLSCVRDNDESQGKTEVSTVIYKIGECMQELLKLWKGFKESDDNINNESFPDGPTLKIRIPAEYVTATNRQVRGGQLWGTDIYTDDSDLVAVLMHTGYCRPTASPPPPAVQELRATIRVLPPQDCYISTSRNIRSRAWGAAVGCSYRVERCCIVKKEGGTIDLQPCLTHTLSVEPTLAPVDVDRTMTPRVAASNALRQQRFVRKVTIQYNQCNEPWIKYSISIVADKGLKKTLYTSARLKKGEVLYLETQSNRYELCFHGEKMVSTMTAPRLPETEKEKLLVNHSHDQSGERNLMDQETIPVDVFRWSRCKKPLPQKTMCSIGIPLPPEYVEVVEENLDWEDVQWSQTGVWIAGIEYALARVHFLSPN